MCDTRRAVPGNGSRIQTSSATQTMKRAGTTHPAYASQPGVVISLLLFTHRDRKIDAATLNEQESASLEIPARSMTPSTVSAFPDLGTTVRAGPTRRSATPA